MATFVGIAKKSKQREVGIELLRIVAMLLIIFHHFCYHGGFLSHITSQNKQQLIAKLISNIFPISINLFVFITGYFSLNNKGNVLKKTIVLWIQVFFYSLIIYLIFLSTKQVKFDKLKLEQIFYPVAYKEYWFFSAYFLLILVSPFISAMLNNITAKQHLYLVIGIVVVLYLISIKGMLGGILEFTRGYSLTWFVCAYIIGAYIKRANIKLKWWGYILFIAVIACVIYLKKEEDFYRFGYADVEIVFVSVLTFMLFKDIKINCDSLNKFITKIASATFGVYLIHDNNFIRSVLYSKIFKVQEYYNSRFATFKILEFTLVVFIACAFIDLIRQGLFWSVITTIKIACAKISNLFKKIKKPNTIEKMGGG
ncbi:MAG: acyltransferase [Clostridia bacterium]|nr:acyltransferase [Clostridia bacterium]